MSTTETHTLPPPMTIDAVALYLNLSRTQVRRHVKSGRLKAYQPGRRLLFLPADVEAFLKSSPTKTAA